MLREKIQEIITKYCDNIESVGPITLNIMPEQLAQEISIAILFLQEPIKLLNESMEQAIQLHEQLEIYYIVDGWKAQYSNDDGNEYIEEADDKTPMGALIKLFSGPLPNRRNNFLRGNNDSKST